MIVSGFFNDSSSSVLNFPSNAKAAVHVNRTRVRKPTSEGIDEAEEALQIPGLIVSDIPMRRNWFVGSNSKG